MNETIFEQVESFASVLKLDFSAEEFAQFAEDQELSEALRTSTFRYLRVRMWNGCGSCPH